jgi:hypothetical protein
MPGIRELSEMKKQKTLDFYIKIGQAGIRVINGTV